MIYVNEQNTILQIPRYKRCIYATTGVHQLLMYNTYTKECYMYKVNDLSPNNKLRYEIPFVFLDEMQYGTYQYYLLPNGEINTCEVNVHNPANTRIMIKHSALMYDGCLLISGGKLLVEASYIARITEGCNQLQNADGNLLSTTVKFKGEPTGDIYKTFDILSTGLIKYEPLKILDTEPEEFNDNQTYKEFRG